MQDFIEELLKVNDTFKNNAKKGMSDINIFEALGVEYKENYHSKFIAYLINPHADHYQELFANEFLKKLGESVQASNFKELTVQDIESVETEACVKDNRRIDILISLKDKRYIIIENKLYAKDQKNQLKDYINHLKNKIKSIDNFHENILTIYLHMDENTEPSQISLGVKNGFKIQNNFIHDSSNKTMSYYFKMDYKWIKEWINLCISTCKDKFEKNEIEKDFKEDMENVIFTLNQYKTLLKWYLTEEFEAKDDVLRFLKENLEKTMTLYKYTKNKNDFKDIEYDKYKKAKDIVKDKWDELCKELVSEFFHELKEKFEKAQSINKHGQWLGYELDENRFNYDWFDFYPEIYKGEDDVRPSIGVYLGKSKYNHFGLTFKINYLEGDEKYKQYINCFQELTGKNTDNICRHNEHYYCDKFENFSNSKEEYAFIYWLINNHGDWTAEFSKILEEFLNKKTIKSALEKINKILKPSK